MNFKKVTALFLIVAMAFTMFAACTLKTPANSGATLEDIAAVSTAAAYLARQVEASGGFISAAQTQEEGAANADAFAYVYDNATAVLALYAAGANWHAGRIADAIVYAQTHDRYFSDGRLRNAYVAGDPRGEGGWIFAGNAKAVRLPGLWKEGKWQEDYYAVSTSTGNMAWAILALCEAASNTTGEEAGEYLDAAVRAADFVLTLRSPAGGFTGGYEGWDGSQTKVTYKSTEHNIDLISAFAYLAELMRETNPEKAQEYKDASDYAMAFVLTMYDEENHCFYTGTEADGETVSVGVMPIDANTWALLTLKGSFAGAAEVFTFIENSIAVEAGFDFSAGDLDGIWNEGTAQMAVCYFTFAYTDKYMAVMQYLNTQVLEGGGMSAADRDGVSTGFMVSGTTVPWVYNNTLNIGATSWFAFAQMQVNPFRYPQVAVSSTGEVVAGNTESDRGAESELLNGEEEGTE